MADTTLTPARLAELRRLLMMRPTAYGLGVAVWRVLPALLDAAEQRDKLAAFKVFVHGRLDAAGVPPEFPEGVHSREGCRIGDRLDWLTDRHDRAVSEFNRMLYERNEARSENARLRADRDAALQVCADAGLTLGQMMLPLASVAQIAALEAEVAALRQQVAGHCERIAKQSDLLTRAAAKRQASDPGQLEQFRRHVADGLYSRDVAWLIAEIDRLTGNTEAK